MSIVSTLDAKKVFTEDKDFPLSTLREMYDDGDIIPDPEYQRDFIYDVKRRSKLIESVLLSIPIPTVYLCREEDETFSVIDGHQRIMSFVTYLKNEYALKGLQEIKELNGKKFSDLEKPIQKKLKSTTLHAICLLKESQELKYEIFKRLNQGAVALKPQELRNCIFRGSFNNMLESIAANNAQLTQMFFGENQRKAYQERILRFFALREFQNYKSSMPATLNDYMSKHQNDSPEDISKLKSLFNGTIDIIKQVLGNAAFRAYSREKGAYMEKFSPTVYDSIVVPFSYFSKNSLMRHADEIREKITDIILNDKEYANYVEKSTSSKSSVIGRITKIYNAILTCMSDNDLSGEKRIFSPSIKAALYYDGYVCSYCGNKILHIEDAEIDHTIPFSLGGVTDISNAQLLHRHCNREKSNNMSENDDWTIDEDDE